MAVYHKRQPKPLSSGSLAVYHAIEEYHSLNGVGPSYTDLMEMTGYRSKSVICHHLNRLEKSGWITRVPYMDRSVIPVHYPRVYYVRKETQ